MGHIVPGEGVQPDPQKIEGMIWWPISKNLRQLRGFLGLTGYYRRFIQGYELIAAPLTSLLKGGAWQWIIKAEEAFQTLKKCTTHAPVLALPDFNKPLIVETDASNSGVRAVLLKGKHPLAYFSKNYPLSRCRHPLM